MPFATAPDGARIYYEQHGEGHAVVFVHGSGGNHAAWWQQVPHFRRSNSVVTLDLRGFGRSDSHMEEFDSLEFPGDIVAVLDDAGIDRAAFVGQSIGAAAALKVAVAHPARAAGVILAHSLGGIASEELSALAKADRAEAEKLPVLDRLMTKRFQEEEPEKTFLFRQMGTFNTAKMPDLRNLAVGGPTLDDVIACGVRVCFLAGENDAVLRPATVRRAHELLPGSLLNVVPNGPHSMYWEAPDLFNAAVGAFLERLFADAER
ncbi:MAG TPA: alpha/beta hydrolase [Gaiellaceae bacterium]|nr:alpha/beta hydrolase [Gaiellaceae bacterium]